MGHDYATLEDSAAGHGFDGLLYKKCTKCGDEIKEVREGEPHDYVKTSESSPTAQAKELQNTAARYAGTSTKKKLPLSVTILSKRREWKLPTPPTDMFSRCAAAAVKKKETSSPHASTTLTP